MTIKKPLCSRMNRSAKSDPAVNDPAPLPKWMFHYLEVVACLPQSLQGLRGHADLFPICPTDRDGEDLTFASQVMTVSIQEIIGCNVSNLTKLEVIDGCTQRGTEHKEIQTTGLQQPIEHQRSFDLGGHCPVSSTAGAALNDSCYVRHGSRMNNAVNRPEFFLGIFHDLLHSRVIRKIG